MSEYRQFVGRSLCWLLAFTIIGLIVLAIGGAWLYMGGWLWGSFTVCLYILVLSQQLKRVEKQGGEKDQQRAVLISMAVRFFLVAALTCIGTKIPGITMSSVVGGILLLFPVLIIDQIVAGIRQRKTNEA